LELSTLLQLVEEARLVSHAERSQRHTAGNLRRRSPHRQAQPMPVIQQGRTVCFARCRRFSSPAGPMRTSSEHVTTTSFAAYQVKATSRHMLTYHTQQSRQTDPRSALYCKTILPALPLQHDSARTSWSRQRASLCTSSSRRRVGIMRSLTLRCKGTPEVE
jgi:hypothetical protein